MKRIIVLFLLLVLISVSALADIDQVVEEYNLHTVITSAQKLIGTPEKEERDGKTSYLYSPADNIKVQITIKDGEARVFSCLCFDESATAEFLAQSMNCVCQLDGYSAMLYCAGDILDLFLQARAGNETEQRSMDSAGLVYLLRKESFGYLFMVAK